MPLLGLAGVAILGMSNRGHRTGRSRAARGCAQRDAAD
jgi:hypothetical protein